MIFELTLYLASLSDVCFKKILDLNNDDEIIQRVKDIGMYYHMNRSSGSPVGALVHGKAKEVFWPLSHFLQRTTQERKDRLAKEIKTCCPDLIDLLCGEILHPFINEG